MGAVLNSRYWRWEANVVHGCGRMRYQWDGWRVFKLLSALLLYELDDASTVGPKCSHASITLRHPVLE